MSEVDFRELEEALLDPEVRSAPERLGALIADDFIEFGSSGRVFCKQDVIDASVDLPDVATPLERFTVESRGADWALVTYLSRITAVDGSVHAALRSSLWTLRDGCWHLRFHQGTPLASE